MLSLLVSNVIAYLVIFLYGFIIFRSIEFGIVKDKSVKFNNISKFIYCFQLALIPFQIYLKFEFSLVTNCCLIVSSFFMHWRCCGWKLKNVISFIKRSRGER